MSVSTSKSRWGIDELTRCSAMLQGISKTTMAMNINWFPKLIVSWVTPISLAKPPVRALARFMRSSWNTNKPRNSRIKTDLSTLDFYKHPSMARSNDEILTSFVRSLLPTTPTLPGCHGLVLDGPTRPPVHPRYRRSSWRCSCLLLLNITVVHV